MNFLFFLRIYSINNSPVQWIVRKVCDPNSKLIIKKLLKYRADPSHSIHEQSRENERFCHFQYGDAQGLASGGWRLGQDLPQFLF